MRKPSDHTCRLMSKVLLLVSLLNVSTLMLKSVALAQPPVSSPGWSYTDSLSMNRYGHTATLLQNGKVLVAGGAGTCSPRCSNLAYGSAELYDPATGKWSTTGSLSRRYGHSATLLPNGQVLVAGGINFGPDIGHISYLNSAEVYDPVTEKWRPTGSLTIIRGDDHQAVLLPNGKVLVVGIPDINSRPIVWSAELYDPATERWSTGTLPMFEYGAGLTLLPNGKFLSTSGNVARIYDPVTEKWSGTGQPTLIQFAGATILLPNGKVLLTGTREDTNSVLAELYNPATGTWSATGSLNNKLYYGSATLLPDGRVLVAGGTDTNSHSHRNAEIYDPATGAWSTASNMITARQFYTATLLSGGKVLVAGGYDGDYDSFGTYLSSAELFDPGLPQAGTVTNVSAASYRLTGLASEAIASGFGTNLATATSGVVTLPLPTQLAGTTIKVKDSAGIERLSPLFYVSPQQVNYQIPPGTATGAATVTITSSNGMVSTGLALIHAVAPSLFAANANGQGVAAAMAQRVKADGSHSYEALAEFDATQNKFVARPLDLGAATDQVYLVLFGTGIRSRSALTAVIATIGSAYGKVSYAGAQPEFVGVDQVNVLLPRNLIGRGEVEVLLTVETQLANPVRISIR